MKIEHLTEETVSDFIKEGRVVIRTWDEGCGYCTKYEPIFNEYIAESQVKAGVLRLYVLKEKKPSAFKRAYMKQDTSENIKETVPGTFVFESGELVARHFGIITKEQLADLVANFKAPLAPAPRQPTTIEEYIARASIIELKASISDSRDIIDLHSHNINIFRAEIAKRNQQPQKAQ